MPSVNLGSPAGVRAQKTPSSDKGNVFPLGCQRFHLRTSVIPAELLFALTYLPSLAINHKKTHLMNACQLHPSFGVPKNATAEDPMRRYFQGTAIGPNYAGHCQPPYHTANAASNRVVMCHGSCDPSTHFNPVGIDMTFYFGDTCTSSYNQGGHTTFAAERREVPPPWFHQNTCGDYSGHQQVFQSSYDASRSGEDVNPPRWQPDPHQEPSTLPQSHLHDAHQDWQSCRGPHGIPPTESM